ncbi:MAG: hypothetical protein KBS83_01010, partial [Lachnospiraceae bacterium]|nr:hypothetical protein [Candidatus Equihabitans merdae]
MPESDEDKIPGTYFNGDGFAAPSGTLSQNPVWHMAYFDYDERKIKYDNEDSRFPVNGGLINGGWSSTDGGGIKMEGKNTTLELYDVTVAGNIAKNNGGAISMTDDYQKLRLTDSRIAFNQAASEDGGGIFTKGNYCKIYLTRSHVDYNLSDDNGGAIAITGTNTVIAGDANHVAPSDSAYPGKWANNSYTAQHYATMNGDHNPFWNRTDNDNSRHVSTEGQASTLAYNIVTNSDYDGGGGGIYVDGKNTAVGGLNILKNLALGFGFNATWCGRGAGVLLNTEGNTIANCNFWHNWSRSEGGGVYVDNDNCAITDVTVTDNYAYSNGWSGGGVYVLGTGNLSLGGQCIIKNNASDGKSRDNLYLGYYNFMYARLYLSMAKDSEVWTWMSGAASSITKVPGTYDERMFYSDDTGYHVEYKDNILSLVKGKSSVDYIAEKYADLPVEELVPENAITEGSRTRLLAQNYISENGYSYPLYQGIAEFASFTDVSEDLSSTFFYSDGYFDQNPKNYNQHLATASMHLAVSSFYSNDGNEDAIFYNVDGNGVYYPVKSNNIRQFMSDIGVKEEDIYLNDFNIQKPGSFTIGVAIGSKTIKLGEEDKKLVIVGVRGGGYESEWVSNLTLGSEGEAKGFGSAADQVFAALSQYLQNKNIDGSSRDTLFWVAGFSRAGATSNLTGARIVDNYDHNGEHTFVYTFEAPQGGNSAVRENDEKYFCIHNLINDGDLVPRVGPSTMGFFRYGVDHYVPGDPAAGSPSSSTGNYKMMQADGNGAETYSYTTWHDNGIYNVGSGSYNQQKPLMLQQLKYIADYDLIFSDYFHAATISY